MKRSCFLIIVFMISITIQAQQLSDFIGMELNIKQSLLIGSYGEYRKSLLTGKGWLEIDNCGNKIVEKIPYNEMTLNQNNGYFEFMFKDRSFSIVPGEIYFDYFPNVHSEYKINMIELARTDPEKYKQAFEENYSIIALFSRPAVISSSSVYREESNGKNIIYDGSLLWNQLFVVRHHIDMSSYLNEQIISWVEGVDGPGIGEWIQLDMTIPESEVYVLNGFVDETRTHLYKQNSRIKNAKVIALTPKGKELIQHIEFKDFVYYKTIAFSEPVKSVRLIIESVYPGSKWQDTAVSGFVATPIYKNYYSEIELQ